MGPVHAASAFHTMEACVEGEKTNRYQKVKRYQRMSRYQRATQYQKVSRREKSESNLPPQRNKRYVAILPPNWQQKQHLPY